MLELSQAVSVCGVLVVLGQSTKATLIDINDLGIGKVEQSCLVDGLAVSLVAFRYLVDQPVWDAQPDDAVDRPGLEGFSWQ